MTLKSISPGEAARLIDKGAVLVDIREADEHARERIAGARSHPLSGIADAAITAPKGVVFHCKSGGRTRANAEKLASAASNCEAYLLEGGIDAWKAAGLPVAQDKEQPIEIMRQVQIAAGSLVLAGILLGFTVAPGFFGLSAFLGAGLVFAGVSGSCMMARLLSVMPWNRPRRV